ncbi:electron transfer flavoprotein beta subunit lysine methyltransferase-like [Anopheles maculipalpis]|uniref:electron transfer flavoprotein beta subunit lysine methyltransferase-like n=1 Tax=Anopheles maculipalpis TaxID=1496333 RepID=UPI002158AF53|nr:electron transfer flavoprotein beta subunit lysine methyltransferase-like [Anopheles maculipalpis]
MNGTGLADIVVRRLRMERTFHTTTCSGKFRAPGAATTTTAIVQMNRCRQHNSSATKQYVPVRGESSQSTINTSKQPPGAPNAASDQSICEELDVINAREKILSNTVLSRQHMTPEIALHLITPDCAIYHQPVGAGNNGIHTGFSADPFWGFFWPGGQALTRFILDTSHVFRGKTVLDVGCGCGASSIAALMVGASHVTANDIDRGHTTERGVEWDHG